jgi:hypothetical protein
MRTESEGDGSDFVKSPKSAMITPILEEYLQVKPPRSSEPFSKYIESLSFMVKGIICGVHKVLLAGATVRTSAWNLGKKFRNHLGRSPLHCSPFKNKEQLTPALGSLFKGMESLAPNVKRQKALSLSLLRHLLVGTQPEVVNSARDHATDLIISALFVAMRAWEYVKPPVEGKTRITTLGCVKFFTKSRVKLSHTDTNLISKAKYVRTDCLRGSYITCYLKAAAPLLTALERLVRQRSIRKLELGSRRGLSQRPRTQSCARYFDLEVPFSSSQGLTPVHPFAPPTTYSELDPSSSPAEPPLTLL